MTNENRRLTVIVSVGAAVSVTVLVLLMLHDQRLQIERRNKAIEEQVHRAVGSRIHNR